MKNPSHINLLYALFLESMNNIWIDDDVQVILIGEDHFDYNSRLKYTEFINKLAEDYNVVVLVEGVKSMKIPKNIKKCPQVCFIKEQDNIKFYGWDSDDVEVRYADLPNIVAIPETFNNYQNIIYKCRNANVCQFLPLLFDRLYLLCKLLHLKYNMDEKIYMNKVKSQFQQRTQSFVDTIQKVIEMNKHTNTKIVVIAGKEHLEEHHSANVNKELKLDILFNYLKNINYQVVIL